MPPPWSRRPAGLALRSADAGWCGLQRTGASAPAGALPIAIGCRCAAGPSSASGTPAIGGSFGGRRGFASALVRLVLQTLSADVGGLGGAYVRQARPMAAVAHAHHQARTIAWKIFDEMKVLHTVKAPTSLRKDAGSHVPLPVMTGLPSTWAGLRQAVRQVQREAAEELHHAWEYISSVAGGSYESLGKVQEQLANYRGLIESKINLEILPYRVAVEPRLVALLCSLELDTAARKMVLYSVPAALGELWRSTDPSYVSPRKRLGIMPESRLPKSLRDRAEAGTWMHRNVAVPLSRLAHEVAMVARAVALSWLFAPVLYSAPLVFSFDYGRDAWCRLLVWTLEVAGPAFIKWGQWAATRPDLLPRDVCDALGRLHANAKAHSFKETERMVRQAFGRPLDYLFEDFETEPIASGSIAQIHRAVLSEAGAAETGYPQGMMVAIKVRHPGVSEMMEKDFALMERIAELVGSLESLQWVRLDESIKQFGAPMREQLDLRNEARNLDRFNANFRRWPECWFPEPLKPLVTEDVLVETFEYGESVLRYVDGTARALIKDDPSATPLRTHICSIGVNIFFKMVLNDNFIHADMHPGNVIVMADPHRVRTWPRRVVSSFQPWDPIAKVIMLDAGMAVSLKKQEQLEVMRFFQACTGLDGRSAGKSVLKLGRQTASPEQQRVYVEAMEKYFGTLTEEDLKHRSSEVLSQTMDLLRQHRINVSGVVSTLLVQMFVLEGWASRLDNEVRIMEILKVMIPTAWNYRFPGAVDRLMRASTATVR